METRNVWKTNRLAMIALVLGIVSVLTSPHFFGLLNDLLPLEPGVHIPSKSIWKMYRQVYIWSGFFTGSNAVICWLISLTGLVTGIVSIDRERQKKWIAVIAITLGIYGVLEHLLGFVMAIMP